MPLPDIPTGIENRANKILDDLATQLIAVQANYRRWHNRYWQGLSSHPIVPQNGVRRAPVKASHPTDQPTSWADAATPPVKLVYDENDRPIPQPSPPKVGINLPATMEIAVRVDTYDGPKGQGYVIAGQIEIGGRLWQKSLNFGPETERQHEWRDVTVEEEA